jgi:hypothetical protein
VSTAFDCERLSTFERKLWNEQVKFLDAGPHTLVRWMNDKSYSWVQSGDACAPITHVAVTEDTHRPAIVYWSSAFVQMSDRPRQTTQKQLENIPAEFVQKMAESPGIRFVAPAGCRDAKNDGRTTESVVGSILAASGVGGMFCPESGTISEDIAPRTIQASVLGGGDTITFKTREEWTASHSGASSIGVPYTEGGYVWNTSIE